LDEEEYLKIINVLKEFSNDIQELVDKREANNAI